MAGDRSHAAPERRGGRRWRHRGREAHRAPNGSQGAHRASQGTRPITKEQGGLSSVMLQRHRTAGGRCYGSVILTFLCTDITNMFPSYDGWLINGDQAEEDEGRRSCRRKGA